MKIDEEPAMWSPKKMWKNRAAGQEPDSSNPNSRGLAYFGYDKIPETDKSRRVLAHFDSVAARYDLMNTILSFGIHYLWKRTAIQLLAPKPGERLLDVCGGTGDLSVAALRALESNGRVVLCDFNRAMIQTGRRKQSQAALRKKVFYVQGDAEQLSFPDHSFDAVMVGFGIRNLTHMEKSFKEIYRVLVPGGRMMCLEFSKPTNALFRWLYDIYSLHIMPLLGEIIVGNRRAYTHLPESIRTFPLPDRLTEILVAIGFRQVRYHKLTNGIAVVHMGSKN